MLVCSAYGRVIVVFGYPFELAFIFDSSGVIGKNWEKVVVTDETGPSSTFGKVIN